MYKIVSKKCLNPTVTMMDIEAPLVARKAEPGQFIILRVDSEGERIPLTVAGFDREGGTVKIIFQTVGATTKKLSELSREECERILEVGASCGIKLYHFKRSDRTLPRVNKVIGFLRSIWFENLLDVGSGRGVFLLPFLDEFPGVPVTAVDVLEKRITLLGDIKRGGAEQLSVVGADICESPFAERSLNE